MRLRVVLAGLVAATGAVLVGGCVVTMSYDDYGDQKGGNDAGADAYVCVPKTCADKNANCGDVPDDCGKILNCGDCGSGETCGGAGPNQCGTGPCQSETCDSLGATCGTVSDGCRTTLECGKCTPPKICGSDGVVNQCVCPGVVITCGSAGAECGQIDDGCGGKTDCGNCGPGMKCSSGNSSGQGFTNKCVCDDPCLKLPEYNAECGSVPDCMGNTKFCACPNGAECQITGAGTLGTCP